MKKILQIFQNRNLRFGFPSIVAFLLMFIGYGGVAQTTLAVGDVSVIGFNLNAPDNFAFVTWVNIADNTYIKFTDNGFLATSSANTSNNGRGGENFVIWRNNTGADILAGTVITIQDNSTAAITNVGTIVSGNLNGLSASGDNIFAYQGTATSGTNPDWSTNLNPTTFNGTILFGLFAQGSSSTTNWLTTGTASANSSYLPTQLNVSNGNIVLSASASRGQYNGLRNNQTTLANYKALVNNPLNWTTGSGAGIITLNTTAFTLSTPNPTVTTIGTLNQVNTTYGTASATPTSFTVSGSNLTNNILITPPTGYEVSQTSGGADGYGATQTLTQSGGTVANTTIYARLKADASVAGSPYVGNIVLSSTGASSVNVATVSSTVSPKVLSIIGITAANKIYDANTTATLSGTPVYSGLANGETFSVTGMATASFTTATVGNGKTVSVSGYTSPSTNYTVSQPNLSANITPAILTITGATATNKIYDGNNIATVTGILSGVISAETVTLNPSGTFSQTNVGSGLTITSTSTLSGVDAGNYSLTQPTGLTADITAKPLTIIGLTANNKVFDGNTTATLSGAATLDGVISGEESNVILTGTPTATFAQSAVGTGIVVTVTGYSLTGLGAGNYSVSQPSGLTANITNSPSPVINSALTASANYGVVSTSYFITATNSPDSYNATGLPTGLSINTSTGEISGTPTDIAGSPFSVTISATNAGGTGTATLVYTITPKSLTIGSPTVTNKVYDGTNTATISGTLVGIVGSDVVSLDGTGTFSQINIGSALVVASTATLSGADAAKYSLTQPTGLTADITVKPLTIIGLTANNKVFDGNTTATLSGTATLDGVISGEENNVVLGGTPVATFNNRNIGTAKTVTITEYSISGSQSGNYIINQPSDLSANITPLALTITNPVAQNKVFDGNTNANITGTLTGVISPDVVNLIGTATFASSAVGNGIAVTSTSTLGGAGAGNYTLTQPVGLTANITAPQFTTGNLVVVNVNTTNAASLIEYSISGSLQQIFTIPSTGTDALTISYSAASEGALSRSESGYYLGLAGYRTGTNGSSTDRVIARINSIGTVNTKSVIPNAEGYGGNNIRAAVFNNDGSRFWTSGAGTGGGVRTNLFEATSGSTLVSTTLTNTRVINIFNNQLYVSSASGAFQGLSSVGTGLPTSTNNTIAILPGFPTTTGPNSYGFTINSTNTIAYVADSRTTALGGIQKWTFNGSTWSLAYTLGTGVTNIGAAGLTVDWTGTNPIIYATTAEATLNRIIKITDSGASSTATNLATSSANNVFKGIAFSPILAPTSVSLSVSSNVGTETGATVITVTVTSSAPVVGNQTVSLAVTGTNITAGDYILSNSIITIPNGGTSGSVTFTVVDDVVAENTETAILTISSPTSGIILGSPTTQNITITDNDNTTPTILMDVNSTSNYIDGGISVSPAGSFVVSGVLNDPTDPAKNLGIDFTIGDAQTAIGSLTVTATSSNISVLPSANLNLTGSGASRNLKITPNAEGFSTVTISVNDGISTTSFAINYASSNASINPTTTRFHTGTSDASTAQMIDNNLMIVADDENQALRMYDRSNSGLPVNSFDFTTSLNLPDISGGTPREVDIEASAKVGNRIYWMGSHSNASSGNNRPNRSRFFATDISGTGNATTLSYIGRYDNLKTELLAWDANNGHGLGANFLGLATSAASGKIPETADGSGFNIEGFEIAPNNSTAYICFRAPLQTTTTRTKALIIPLTNFADLVSGNPTSTTATFGNPIQLDLGGRAIREMKKNASGEYLIIAGPHDGSTGIAPKDFRFYTWTGNPNDAPILRSANLTALNANGSFESIVDLPSPLVANSNLQVLVDNGDAVFYGDGTIAKELPQNNHKKFRSETINLGSAVIAIGSIAGTSFCENTSINVPFTTTETFNAGNVFTAQLSDANGSFISPVSIGTLSGTSTGTIIATIPAGTVSGSGYRIRVVSSNLSITGADNGTNLTITNCTPLTIIKSITTGNWESASTWDLGRIPQAGDLVIIDQNHEITLNGTGTVKKIEYQGTGKLILNSTSSTLNTGL